MRVCAFNEIIYTSLCAALHSLTLRRPSLMLHPFTSIIPGMRFRIVSVLGPIVSDFCIFFSHPHTGRRHHGRSSTWRCLLLLCLSGGGGGGGAAVTSATTISSKAANDANAVVAMEGYSAEITPLTQCTPHVLTVFAKTPRSSPGRRHWIPIHIYLYTLCSLCRSLSLTPVAGTADSQRMFVQVATAVAVAKLLLLLLFYYTYYYYIFFLINASLYIISSFFKCGRSILRDSTTKINIYAIRTYYRCV